MKQFKTKLNGQFLDILFLCMFLYLFLSVFKCLLHQSVLLMAPKNGYFVARSAELKLLKVDLSKSVARLGKDKVHEAP